jgi:cysteinyl-tRNA synthetase
MIAGARVEVDEPEKEPVRFLLYGKNQKKTSHSESPWGLGRPGWHIECSAMSLKHLGESFDIHGGGADLLFPHHENEIAQSEAFTGKPFARFWVHNGFITIDKEKMSKSLGNFFTIREVLDTFDPEVIRLFLLSTHYRSPIEFSDEQLHESETSIDRYYSTIMRINDFLEKDYNVKNDFSNAGKIFKDLLFSFRDRFGEAMDDDFNTALALGHMLRSSGRQTDFSIINPRGTKDRELLLMTKELLSEAGFSIYSTDPP